jgi:DNA polymerase III delta prime subunit
LLSDRWRPTTLREIVGQTEAVSKLWKFAESWQGNRPPRVRAALLEGPSGTGKTAAAYALAADTNWGLIEMSASDARNKDAIQQIAGRASLTNTFSDDGRYLSAAKGGRSLILLDDVDGISGRSGPAAESAPRFAKTAPNFREFLRSRYREIAALNQAWGLVAGEEPAPYASFDDLATVAPRGNLGKRPAVRRDVEDWQRPAKASDLTDRGGLGVVTELVRETRQPIVLTATDPRLLSRASAVFRTGVVHIRFYPVRFEALRAHLEKIVIEEKLGVPPAVVNTVVKSANGDVRAALNDLDLASTFHGLQERHLVPPTLNARDVLGTRDAEMNLFEAVDQILSSGRFWRAGAVLDQVGSSPDDLLLWIEENIPRFARGPAELSAAMVMLARAQHQLFRANRWRIWTLWSYATELMTGGVSLALFPQGVPPNRPVPSVEFPRFLSGMGGSRSLRANRDALASKAGAYTHVSRRRAREIMLPFLERLYREGPRDRNAREIESYHRELVLIARSIGLEARDLAYLLQVEDDHPSVQNLLREETGTSRSSETSGSAEGSTEGLGTKLSKRGQRTLDGL